MDGNDAPSPRVSEESADTGLLRIHSPLPSVAISGDEGSEGATGDSTSHGSIREKHEVEALDQPKHPPHWRLRWSSQWSWELLAITTSVSALISTAAVLFAYDGKTLDEWRVALRPNTVISALSTLAKSSMLMVIGEGLGQLKWVYFQQRAHRLRDFEIFDEASRGPLGSFRLLLRVNKRAFVALVGATIVLLALAMDPFVQQVISYEQKYVTETSGRALIGANRLYLVDKRNSSTGSSMYATVKDIEMAAAMNAAVFAAPRQPSLICVSGRCEWMEYTTLGVCSDCQEITMSMNSSHTCEDRMFAGVEPSPDSAPLSTCTWTIDFFTVQGSAHCTSDRGFILQTTIFNATVIPAPPMGATDQPGIATIVMFKFEEDVFVDGKGHCRPILHEVQKCSLTWCLKTYSTSRVENSTLAEGSIAREDLKVLRSHYPVFADGCADPPNSPGIAMNQFPNWLIRRNYQLEQNQCPTPQDYHEAFEINGMQGLLDEISNVFRTAADIDKGDSVAQWLYRVDTIPRIMDDVATSMTNVIRNANSTAVAGKSMQQKTFIEVHWTWMALPASLVLLSICFLAASMIFATEKSQTVWKTSSLATLFHGLQGWEDADTREMKLNDINCSAKNMWACLREDEKGNWKLIKQG